VLPWMGSAGAEWADGVGQLIFQQYPLDDKIKDEIQRQDQDPCALSPEFVWAEHGRILRETAHAALLALLASGDEDTRGKSFCRIALSDHEHSMDVLALCIKELGEGLLDDSTVVRQASCDALIRMMENGNEALCAGRTVGGRTGYASQARHARSLRTALMELVSYGAQSEGTPDRLDAQKLHQALCEAMVRTTARNTDDASGASSVDLASPCSRWMVRECALEALAELYRGLDCPKTQKEKEEHKALGGRSHLKVIRKRLTDKHWQVRLAAVRAYTAMGEISARHNYAVVALLHDERDEVRDAAQHFLKAQKNLELSQDGCAITGTLDNVHAWWSDSEGIASDCPSDERDAVIAELFPRLQRKDECKVDSNSDTEQILDSMHNPQDHASSTHSREPRNAEGRKQRQSKRMQARKLVEQKRHEREEQKKTRHQQRERAHDQKHCGFE